MAKNIKQIFFWLAFAASLLLFFTPVPTGGRDEFDLDKVMHIAVFFTLILTARSAYPNKKIVFAIILVAYAFISEFIQGKYLPLRHFDWYDIIADLIGLALGSFTIFIFFKTKSDEQNKNESLAE